MPQQSKRRLRRKKKRSTSSLDHHPALQWFVKAVGAVLGLAALVFLIQFATDTRAKQMSAHSSAASSLLRTKRAAPPDTTQFPALSRPLPPAVPIFAPVPNAEQVRQETMTGQHPSLAGLMAIFQKFMYDLHMTNQRLAAQRAKAGDIIQAVFDLTSAQLGALDAVYRDKLLFPVRDDDSIFLSLAAYREHLLNDTMAYAFDAAQHPDRLFIGTVVQNCFGKVLADGKTIDTSGLPCKSGVEVVGQHHPGGRGDKTKVYDRPPDVNGIETFCAVPKYKKYCDNGQVRVLYVHETEALGPAVARYFASKLWGGETYFVQCDSHLMFAQDWDEKYRLEIQATRNYPKSVLSSYPPGFQATTNGRVHESNGSRLCSCSTRVEDPNPIVRINTGIPYSGHEPRPTQIPFIAAGFFFARAEFLRDIPFDPFLPWLFMGEEIALSMRAWTHGWDIYAPRKNLIAHQYRPGYMGLPKFWGTVNRLFHGSANNNVLQAPVIKRVKNMVGYPDSTLDIIERDEIEIVLTDIEHYGLGRTRSWEAYLDFANMHIDEQNDAIECKRIAWCNNGEKD